LILIYHPAGKHVSGLDLHPAGGKLWVHAHIEKDGKVVTRIGQNGKPLPGQPEVPHGARRLVDECKSDLRKAIGKGRKQVALWQRQQAVARRVPRGGGGGKAGKVIGGISVLLASAKFVEAAFAHGADEEIDKVADAARDFAQDNSFFNCCQYMIAMRDLFVALGMESERHAYVCASQNHP